MVFSFVAPRIDIWYILKVLKHGSYTRKGTYKDPYQESQIRLAEYYFCIYRSGTIRPFAAELIEWREHVDHGKDIETPTCPSPVVI